MTREPRQADPPGRGRETHAAHDRELDQPWPQHHPLDESGPVRVHHNGDWYVGDLSVTRHEPDTGWWGMVRFVVGVGMMHHHWKHESELAPVSAGVAQ